MLNNEEELLTFWEEIRTNQVVIKEMADKFESRKSLLSDENFKNLDTIVNALEKLNGKAAFEFKVNMEKLNINLNKDELEKNLVQKITDKTGELASKLEKENRKIAKKLEDLNDSITTINNWLFVGGIALGGLTVEMWNLLKSM